VNQKKVYILLEPFAFFVLGLISAVDGIRIIMNSDSQSVYQALGPGGYIIIVGLALMGCSLLYIFFLLNRNAPAVVGGSTVNREQKMLMLKLILAMAVYIISIDLIGFSWATFGFFIIIFKILRVSWQKTVLMSIIFTIPLRFIFWDWLSMSFPKGLFDLYF